MFTAAISILTFIYLLITSSIVLLNGAKRNINISLAAALIFIGLWLIGIAALPTTFGGNIINGRLIFTFGLIGIEFLYLFTYFFTGSSNSMVRFLVGPKILVPVALLLAVLSTTPLVVKSIAVAGDGRLPKPVFGPVYPFLVFWVIVTAIAIAWLLSKAYKRSAGLQKSQLQTILFGLIIFISTAISTNVILPGVFGTAEPAKYTPLSTIILAFFLSYAVLKHKFLDIRPVVARSFAYLLTVFFIAFIYVGIAFGIAAAVFANDTPQLGQQIFYLGFTIFAALIFQPIKRYFDKFTNRIFYRDAYDPQAFLDELSAALVSNMELESLLKAAGKTVDKHLKAQFCNYVLRPAKDTRTLRVFGARTAELTPEEFSVIHKAIHPSKTKVLLATDLEDSNSELANVLRKYSVMAVATLMAHGENIGYLLVGDKKSGNIYSKQDARMIDIISEELAIAIQNSLRFEEIKQFNVTLQEKVHEATKEIRQANTRLKSLDESKDEFISMASHQLRTPLTVIKGYLSMLLEGDIGHLDAKQKEAVQSAYDGSERMVFLIGDLLNVSRLQTGKFQIDNTPVNLSKVIDSEVEQLQKTAANHGLSLVFRRPDKFPSLMLDETKIRQVIMNFIDNAIYYTPNSGSIEVALAESGKEIAFTVTDTGLGIPKAEQHHLFTKFYRAGNARKMRPDGTGLGLYMAKKIVVAQGGAIIFSSTEGKGSTFGFSIPKAALGAKS